MTQRQVQFEESFINYLKRIPKDVRNDRRNILFKLYGLAPESDGNSWDLEKLSMMVNEVIDTEKVWEEKRKEIKGWTKPVDPNISTLYKCSSIKAKSLNNFTATSITNINMRVYQILVDMCLEADSNERNCQVNISRSFLVPM